MLTTRADSDAGRSASCWECDTTTIQPIYSALGTLSRRTLSVALCPDCYRQSYLPLVVEGATLDGQKATARTPSMP